MPDPTPEEVMQGARLAGGRLRLARAEVMRLQSTLLPAVVDYQNERDHLTIPRPAAFRYARTNLGKLALPTVVIGAYLDAHSLAIRTQGKITTLSITVLGEPTEVGEQVDDLWDIAELAAQLMKKTSNNWHLSDGRLLWISCKLQSIDDALPDYWKQYAGVRAEFIINQAGCDLWTPAT
jgi:hypothetical protein